MPAAELLKEARRQIRTLREQHVAEADNVPVILHASASGPSDEQIRTDNRRAQLSFVVQRMIRGLVAEYPDMTLDEVTAATRRAWPAARGPAAIRWATPTIIRLLRRAESALLLESPHYGRRGARETIAEALGVRFHTVEKLLARKPRRKN